MAYTCEPPAGSLWRVTVGVQDTACGTIAPKRRELQVCPWGTRHPA